ncbi:glucuronosyltransferase [Erythrobacter sp. YT30]|nr:glucuronosyltransferase [Erythrobacter sp. YT30]
MGSGSLRKRPKRVLAAASGGGHWEQLMLLAPALDACDVRFATTDAAMAVRHGKEGAAILPDCNQNTPVSAAKCSFVAMFLVFRSRLDIVISTGAAPGFLCILWGRITGARTLWIDSIANAEDLLMCGKLSKRLAHECLTQWEHLSKEPQPKFRGAIL